MCQAPNYAENKINSKLINRAAANFIWIYLFLLATPAYVPTQISRAKRETLMISLSTMLRSRHQQMLLSSRIRSIHLTLSLSSPASGHDDMSSSKSDEATSASSTPATGHASAPTSSSNAASSAADADDLLVNDDLRDVFRILYDDGGDDGEAEEWSEDEKQVEKVRKMQSLQPVYGTAMPELTQRIRAGRCASTDA